MASPDQTEKGLAMSTTPAEIFAASRSDNPFAIHRAEHLGKDLYRYFAKPEFFSYRLGAKSLVLVGGRGCGKTMFFIYHTYDSKRLEHYDSTTGRSRVLENETVLGIYLHAKSDVVTAFVHRNLDEQAWTRVFGHYFNVVVAQQIAKIAEDIKAVYQLSDTFEASLCRKAAFLLGIDDPPRTYGALSARLVDAELEIIRYVGNPSRFPEPVLTLPGILPKTLADALTTELPLSNKVFHVFVDEYENLLEYQQRIINTLIKTPALSFVVDIGLRKEGWKTRSTLAPGESISDPHDFNVFEFEVDLTPDAYAELVAETCRKRLQNFSVPHSVAFNAHSISAYLGEYDLRAELDGILAGKDRRRLPYKARMKALLKEKLSDERTRTRLFEVLGNGDDELLNRLNYCLLLQGKNPEALSADLDKFRADLPSRYKDWLHNYSLGIVFLLCRDVGVNKRYWGFTTFCLMSSGIIRYFLELCETAFTIAQRRGFTFSNPRQLTMTEQDSAAQAVSARKVEEVDSYTPHGSNLKNLVAVLGSVFESLHEDQRVSEPERNHFTTRPEELSDIARSVLRSAVLWNVLQERRITKDKAPSNIGTQTEYHLNHIYSPYFQISYRRKRSLYINPSLLERILSLDLRGAKAAGRKILSNRAVRPVDQLDPDSDFPGTQTELWVRRFESEE